MMGAPLESDGASSYTRNDSRNLVQEWLSDKEARNASSAYVTNNQQFRELDPTNKDFILGKSQYELFYTLYKKMIQVYLVALISLINSKEMPVRRELPLSKK